MPEQVYSDPILMRGDMVASLSAQPLQQGNPGDADFGMVMQDVTALGGASSFYRLVWHSNTNTTDVEFSNGQIWRLESYNSAADGDGDPATGNDGWSTVPGYSNIVPRQDLATNLGAGDEYVVFADLGGGAPYLLYDLEGGLPSAPTNLTYLGNDEDGDPGEGDNDGELDFYDSYISAPCFAAGTLIDTPKGPRAVETLTRGDLVYSSDGQAEPVLWAGGRIQTEDEMRAHPKLAPVRIAAGALGDGVPARDLTVSPQHRVLLRSAIVKRMFDASEILVPAKDLVGWPGIMRAPAGDIAYHHVLFARHLVLHSDGAETESLYLGEQSLRALGQTALHTIRRRMPGVEHFVGTFPGARPFASGARVRRLLNRHRANGLPLCTKAPVDLPRPLCA